MNLVATGWPRSNTRLKIEFGLLLLTLLVAVAVRAWRLDGVPPGFTHDEAGHGHDAVAILSGDRPLYQTVGYGREPLYDYGVAGLMALFGPTGSTLRLSPVLLGLATLLLTYAWARSAFDDPTALAAVAFQATSFWSLSTCRQALRSGLLPLLFTAAVYFYWRFFRSPNRRRLVSGALLALFIGASLYTYMPARVAWVAFVAFLAYLALFHRSTFGRVWLPTLAGVLAGLALSIPLFAYLGRHPGAEQRLDMLDAPLQALKQGDLSVVLDRAQSALAGFLLPGHGDEFLAYNIPGRPVFDWAVGALFLIGLGVCLWRWRRPIYAFCLIWLIVGISPSLITGATASSTRSIVALPVVFLLPGLTIATGARWVRSHWGDRAAWAVGTAAAALIVASGAASVQAYFVTWGKSPDVRAAYQHTLVEMAHYVEDQPQTGLVAVSSLYPQAPHDPYVWEMSLRRRTRALVPFASPSCPLAAPTMRWFDARWALLLPQEPDSRLVAPSSALPDSYFSDLPGLHLQNQVLLHPDDLDPFFQVYDWEPLTSLAALEVQAQGVPTDLSPPVDLAGALQFLGYDLRTPNLPPGGTVELVTLWRVTDPAKLRPAELTDVSAELVFFTHALDGSNQVVGQQDRLDAPAWCWQASDVVAQIHRFELPGDLPPGPLSLEIGVYRRADLSRLPVLVDGQTVDDHILLPALEIITP